MHHRHPELTAALQEMMDKLDVIVRRGGYEGDPILMFLAGGMAVHYYCGSRYAEDVDATFSRRMILPYDELTVRYLRDGQTPSTIYLDPTYNDTFALIHPDHQEESREWEGIGNDKRLIHLRVFAPVDLAISKVARFSPSDQEDIRSLAAMGYVTAAEMMTRAEEALRYYVGDTHWIHFNLNQICTEIAQTSTL